MKPNRGRIMMMNISKLGGAIVLLATAMFAGGPPLFVQAPAASDAPPELSKFQDVELRLVQFRMNGKEIVIPSTVTITLTFQKGGQITGQSPVNHYGGVFAATSNGKISVQLGMATQMAGPPELMELERQYFDALSRVQQIMLKSDRVILEDDKTSMEFAVSRARQLGS